MQQQGRQDAAAEVQAVFSMTNTHSFNANQSSDLANEFAGSSGQVTDRNLDTPQPCIHPNPAEITQTQTGMFHLNAGSDPGPIQANRQLQVIAQPTSLLNRLIVHSPGLLLGSRCYSDASTAPDTPISTPRIEGIGVFIINTQLQPPQQVYIKAKMMHTTSVIMAEAAALALATQVTENLQLSDISFLSDNQQLVRFMNGSDLSNPPDWRMKPFT
jgi:hypothetical protein